MATKQPNKKFKPYVGRCFTLKNYTDLAHYPKIVLIMDEKRNEVMFLDLKGVPMWISKFYLRDEAIESRVFASEDTLTDAMTMIETLRSFVVNQSKDTPDDLKRNKILNKKVSILLQKMRDLALRTVGVDYAPPMEEAAEAEESLETSS